jgi:hypothetical protein
MRTVGVAGDSVRLSYNVQIFVAVAKLYGAVPRRNVAWIFVKGQAQYVACMQYVPYVLAFAVDGNAVKAVGKLQQAYVTRGVVEMVFQKLLYRPAVVCSCDGVS